MEPTDTVAFAELRTILTEDFDAPLVNRVIMCLRTDAPGSTTVRLNDIRPLLEDNLPRNTINRIVMAARLFIPLSPK